MIDHTYPAKYKEMSLDSGSVLLELDLGFNLKYEYWFRLFTGGAYTRMQSWHSVQNQLEQADEMLVRSHAPHARGHRYIADITYRIGDEWYNMAKWLKDNDLLWKGKQNASKQS